ncbi:hypothetical protein JNUCC0626_49910 (plasmid) [Lentzea sp. JNUCC 0626]|uniref:hypothetical protein n=1 Tax=Lentzea sp. JNUCC 0626 TaxID=3367513 RepID=UPI003748B019
MITIRKGTTAGLLLVTAALLGTGACTGPDTDAAGPAGTGATGTAQADPGIEKRRAGRAEGSLVLGDLNKPKTAQELGAPFDPCSTITWNDFPAEVRPDDGKPHTPQLRQPGKDDPFDIRCAFDNSGKVAINPDGSSTGTPGGYFIVSVVWAGGDKLNADPAKRQGAEAKTWNGKAGLIQRFPDDPKSGKSCIAMAKLGNGVGGASVTNGRFGTDPCVIADALVNAITARAK